MLSPARLSLFNFTNIAFCSGVTSLGAVNSSWSYELFLSRDFADLASDLIAQFLCFTLLISASCKNISTIHRTRKSVDKQSLYSSTFFFFLKRFLILENKNGGVATPAKKAKTPYNCIFPCIIHSVQTMNIPPMQTVANRSVNARSNGFDFRRYNSAKSPPASPARRQNAKHIACVFALAPR